MAAFAKLAESTTHRKRSRLRAVKPMGLALPKKFSQRNSAMPPDVRKRSALPSTGSTNLGLRPKLGRSPKFNIELAGRPEAFRTSDGTAVPLKEFLGKSNFDPKQQHSLCANC